MNYTHNYLDESPENYSGWRSPISKGHMYDSMYITFLKWQHYKNREQIHGCQGLKRGWEQEESGCGHKRTTRGIHMVKEMLFILTVSMSTDIVILYPFFFLQDDYHWGNWVNDALESLCIIYCNFIWMYSFLEIQKGLIKKEKLLIFVWRPFSSFQMPWNQSVFVNSN